MPAVVAPDNSGAGTVDGVTCPGLTSCVAVEVDGSALGEAIYSVGAVFGGVWFWSPSTAIAPDASNEGGRDGVSCAGVSDCVAVGEDDKGQSIDSSGSESGGVWTWSTATAYAKDRLTRQESGQRRRRLPEATGQGRGDLEDSDVVVSAPSDGDHHQAVVPAPHVPDVVRPEATRFCVDPFGL